jgi:hypothetical protein
MEPGALLTDELQHGVYRLFWPMAQASSFKVLPHA